MANVSSREDALQSAAELIHKTVDAANGVTTATVATACLEVARLAIEKDRSDAIVLAALDTCGKVLASTENVPALPVLKLTPTEQRIINCIGTGKVLGKTIAKTLERADNCNSLRDSLASMVRHGILENERGSLDGYSVASMFHGLIKTNAPLRSGNPPVIDYDVPGNGCEVDGLEADCLRALEGERLQAKEVATKLADAGKVYNPGSVARMLTGLYQGGRLNKSKEGYAVKHEPQEEATPDVFRQRIAHANGYHATNGKH